MSLGGLFRSARKRLYDFQRAQVRPATQPKARKPRMPGVTRPAATKRKNIELDTQLPGLDGGPPRSSAPTRKRGRKRGRRCG